MVGWVLLMATEPGCLWDFGERSIRMEPADSVRLAIDAGPSGQAPSTRQWLVEANQQLSQFLPEGCPRPLLTDDMRAGNGEVLGSGGGGRVSGDNGEMGEGDGKAVDVCRHFGIDPCGLQSLFKNYCGLRYTAQSASRGYCIDQTAPPWPGFEDVWIPIHIPLKGRELALSGRLGYARDARGNIIDADCIVMLPGLFGDHGVKRSSDLAIPLRQAGFHVLHLEIRGHGQTERRYPRMYHTYGVLETDDLMQVSDWLERQPHVRRTGLIAYCWSANIALLAAWQDGRRPDDPMVPEPLKPFMPGYNPQRRRFRAGVIAFSPVVRWEDLLDELDRERSRWKHPIFAAIQDTVRHRMKLKGFPCPCGNLRLLIEYEHRANGIPMPHGSLEGYPYLRLLPYKGQPAGDKLEWARVPVLIVHGADDPLIPAQDVADLLASVKNPLVAGVILPTGGHTGFAAFAPRYYLSLVANFFDPKTGPGGYDGQLGSPPEEDRLSYCP
jgi:pimeloyl-ACP methyl ester carboxylesterase